MLGEICLRATYYLAYATRIEIEFRNAKMLRSCKLQFIVGEPLNLMLCK